jgi:hypothetical protein
MLKPQVTGDPVSAVPVVKRDEGPHASDQAGLPQFHPERAEATVDPDRPFRVPMRSGS